MNIHDGSPITNVSELFSRDLQKFKSSELQSSILFPKLIEFSSSQPLKKLLENILSQLEENIILLETIGDELVISSEEITGIGTVGIIDEGEQMMLEVAEKQIKDISIIETLLRIHHDQIATCWILLHLARSLQSQVAVTAIQRILIQKNTILKKLTTIGRLITKNLS